MTFIIAGKRWRVICASQKELKEVLQHSGISDVEGACIDKPERLIVLRTNPSLDTVIHEITHAFWFTYGPKYRRISDQHEQIAWFFGKYGNRIVKLAHKVRRELS